MLTAGTVWVALVTYVLMLVALRYSKRRVFHVPVMILVMLFDLGMPVYLYLNKEWHRRLIVESDLLTSLPLWTHIVMIIMLYALYVVQIRTALRLLRGDDSVRSDHHDQGRGVLLIRAIVIVSGALLVE
jgi:hypothetical protein